MEKDTQSVTVAVVGICGAPQLDRCLSALRRQEGAPAFNIIVVYDPHLKDVPSLGGKYPDVRLIANEGQRSPLELASTAIRESNGDLILLTEDHCEPDRSWVKTLVEAQEQRYAAVGGVVETDAKSAVDFAFYLVDFFRYGGKVSEGASPSLTVCNVSYRRAYLEEIRSIWQEFFHETAVNDALRRRFGPLWLTPSARVVMRRHVTFVDSLRERYAFGRLFGATRIKFASRGRVLCYKLFAPALPIVILGRITHKILKSPSALTAFLRALPALTSMILAWSWGEWLGYLTERRSSWLIVAPEVRNERESQRSPFFSAEPRATGEGSS